MLIPKDLITKGDIPKLNNDLTTSDLLDEDNMATDSATKVPSQQSVKAYVDAIPDVIDEDNFATDSATRPPSQQSVKAYITANTASTGTGGATFTGNINLNSQKEIRFYDSDGSNYVALKGAATIGSNVTWIMPATDGAASTTLTTDGSGNLSWAAAGGGADITTIMKLTNL